MIAISPLLQKEKREEEAKFEGYKSTFQEKTLIESFLLCPFPAVNVSLRIYLLCPISRMLLEYKGKIFFNIQPSTCANVFPLKAGHNTNKMQCVYGVGVDPLLQFLSVIQLC